MFCDGLREFDPRIVERVCEDVGRVAPEEFEPRFPPLHVLRGRCQVIRRYEDEQAAARSRPALPAYHQKPVSPDEWARFKDAVAQVVKRKAMK